MDNKTISLESMKNMSIDEILELYRNGYRLELLPSETVMSPTASCPTNIMQGTTHTIRVERDPTKTGTPDYVYKWYLDGTLKETYPTSGKTSDTSHTFTYTFNEAVGSHTIKGEITDSCNKTSTEQCTITIVVCPDLQTNLTVST